MGYVILVSAELLRYGRQAGSAGLNPCTERAKPLRGYGVTSLKALLFQPDCSSLGFLTPSGGWQ